jgi:O-antigen/teichoic acid export membrane protein
MVGATLTIFLLYSYGEQIYQTWLAGTVLYEKQLMVLFLLFLLQQVFWNTCSNFLMAVNVHYTLSKVMVASSILSVGLAWVGATLQGTEGLVVGMTVADLVLPVWLVPYLMRRYNATFTFTFFAAELVPPCVVIFAMFFYPPFAFGLTIFLLIWWWAAAKSIFRMRPGILNTDAGAKGIPGQ